MPGRGQGQGQGQGEGHSGGDGRGNAGRTEDALGGHGRSAESPGHLKRAAGEQSARDLAPGRLDRVADGPDDERDVEDRLRRG
jgi:hypothetical protein